MRKILPEVLVAGCCSSQGILLSVLIGETSQYNTHSLQKGLSSGMIEGRDSTWEGLTPRVRPFEIFDSIAIKYYIPTPYLLIRNHFSAH